MSGCEIFALEGHRSGEGTRELRRWEPIGFVRWDQQALSCPCCEISSPPHGLGWVERFLLFCQMGLSRGWSGAARSRRFAHGIVTLHFVIDREQNQQSGSYQKCKQNTEYNRNNPMSTSEFNPFRSCDYLCCADPDPEGKFIPILRLSDLRLPNRGGRWT